MTNTGGTTNTDCASNKARHCEAIFEQSSNTILANMSHELRTPLNGIIGFSELLERRSFGPLTERQRTYVQNIQACGWRLLKLVIDIVDLSKIEVGDLPLSREWISLDPVVEAALGAAQAFADKKRIGLGASLQPDLPKVWVDPARMQQALGNLLAVAVRSTPDGGSVRLTARENQACVCVFVTDTGIQADAEEAPRLGCQIDPVESSSCEQTEDAGLGLALARRLLEMHGGRIHVSTGVGGASAFTVTIPLNQQNEEGWNDAA